MKSHWMTCGGEAMFLHDLKQKIEKDIRAVLLAAPKVPWDNGRPLFVVKR